MKKSKIHLAVVIELTRCEYVTIITKHSLLSPFVRADFDDIVVYFLHF